MSLLIFIIVSIIINYKENIYQEENKILAKNIATNISLAYSTNIPISKYEEPTVYEDFTLSELGTKIDNVLNSTLDGYGNYIAKAALDNNVDPLIASAIILVETGCHWNCSYLTNNCSNVGGMVGYGCGSYASFDSLEGGINAFISNLSRNYFSMGLTTPELINTKYATNPNWYSDVYYYINLIRAS